MKKFVAMMALVLALPAHAAEEKPYELSDRDKMVEVPVLARDVDRGAMIQPGDIAWQEVLERKVHRGTVTDPAAIVGMLTRKPLKSGEPVTESALAKPRIIERGGMVAMVYRTQHMEIKDMGVAMENGSVGDVIRVKNDKSGKVVLAKVMKNGDVEISL